MSNTEIFDEQIREAENWIKALQEEIDELTVEAARDGNYSKLDRIYEASARLSSVKFQLDKIKMFRVKNNI